MKFPPGMWTKWKLIISSPRFLQLNPHPFNSAAENFGEYKLNEALSHKTNLSSTSDFRGKCFGIYVYSLQYTYEWTSAALQQVALGT